MNAPTLRIYQRTAISRIDQAFAAGRRALLVVAPTGSGKTVIAAELIRREAADGRQILFLAPRRELVHQTCRKLADVGVNHGVILAGDKRHNLYSPIQVGSIDTIRARKHKLSLLTPDLIIADEAHLYLTEIRKRLLEYWPAARRIGLTATPCRKDGRGLRLLFDKLIEVESVADLTAQGHLVPARYFSIATPDLSQVHTVGGDYHSGELAMAMAPLVADIPQTWLERAGNRRTVVFAVNVAHSVALCDKFKSLGVHAEHVDGRTPTSEREAIFRRFTSGETQVLCNCLIASIGFDLPDLDCIQLARPTKSLALYLQMLGRGLRPASGKTDCLVLDHSGCVHELGFAHDERSWTLDGHSDLATSKSVRAAAEGNELTCPQCSRVFNGSRQCPQCGYYFAPIGEEIQTLDGELVEVGAHPLASEVERRSFYLELRGFAFEHNYLTGWAAHKYKEKYGVFPPWHWNDASVSSPSLTTRRWIKSRQIAFAKARGQAATA